MDTDSEKSNKGIEKKMPSNSINQTIVENSIKESAELLAIDIINDMADPRDAYKIKGAKEFYVNLPTECKLSNKRYFVCLDHKTTIDEIYDIAGELLRYE